MVVKDTSVWNSKGEEENRYFNIAPFMNFFTLYKFQSTGHSWHWIQTLHIRQTCSLYPFLTASLCTHHSKSLGRRCSITSHFLFLLSLLLETLRPFRSAIITTRQYSLKSSIPSYQRFIITEGVNCFINLYELCKFKEYIGR